MTTKICIKCDIMQNITCFEDNISRGVLSKRNVCKLCRKKQHIANREKKSVLIDYQNTDKIKKCLVCEIELNILQYNRNKNFIDGYCKICKKCDSMKKQKEYKERKERIQIVTNITHKICFNCRINKDISKFKQTLKSKDGYFQICTDCRPNNWTKEKQKASEKKYVDNNKDKIREKWKRRGKQINRRIRDSLNHRISYILKLNNTNKNNKTFKYLECNKEYLKSWFEYLFEDGMSWNNYGEWHIDHVVPCSSFDLSNEDEQKKCFS